MTTTGASTPPVRLRLGPRSIGGLAGLAPAALVWLFLTITGGVAPRFDNALAMGGITLGAMVVGWLAGPLARGSYRSDLFALIVYALLAAAAYLFIGSVKGAWIDVPDGGPADPADRVWRMIGQLAYGLLYLPFWAAFVSPFAFAWVVGIRLVRRRIRLTPTLVPPPIEVPHPATFGRVRPQRLALLGAVIVLVYGLFVALLPFALYDDPRPPWWAYRPIALFGLFGVPAAVAAIGAVRRVRPLLVAAGVLCLAQAYIAFSGVTIGFVVPGLLLMALGSADSWPAAARVSRASLLGGGAVIALTIGAWVSLFALTTPRCYVTTRTESGAVVTTEVPASQMLYGPMPIQGDGGGCSSAELTLEGMSVSAVLAIGALAFAALGASGRRAPDPA